MKDLEFQTSETPQDQLYSSKHREIDSLLKSRGKLKRGRSAALSLQAKSMIERSRLHDLDEFVQYEEWVVRVYELVRREWDAPFGRMYDQKLFYEILLFFELYKCAMVHKKNNSIVFS